MKLIQKVHIRALSGLPTRSNFLRDRIMSKTLVSVNVAKCKGVAALIANITIPEEKEEVSIDGLDSTETSNLLLLAVVLCHQTQSLTGWLDGKSFKGWDYLIRRLIREAIANRAVLQPTFWQDCTSDSLATLFFEPSHPVILPGIQTRCELLNDLGTHLIQNGAPHLLHMYKQADRRAVTGDFSLFAQLRNRLAFSDPVKKKFSFLTALMKNCIGLTFSDAAAIPPPVDYHEIRGHLRIGTVTVLDQGLIDKINRQDLVAEEEDVAVRQAISDAIMNISTTVGTTTPSALHYFFWNIFRGVCLRTSPNCADYDATLSALPDRYFHLLPRNGDRRPCLFHETCLASGIPNPPAEYRFATHWY